MKIKVLWVSLRLFTEQQETQTAVWLKSLAVKLAQIEGLEISNISTDSDVSIVNRVDFRNIKQWALPSFKLGKDGLPPISIRDSFEQILADVNPDIIQVWGSENPLGLLPIIIDFPAYKVLTIQGVLSSIYDRSLLGLSLKDILSTIGIRELITFKNIYFTARSFIRDGKMEIQMIKRSNFIITQSIWTMSQIKHLNKNAYYYKVNRQLRDEFLSVQNSWLDFPHSSAVIYSAAVGYTLKGLHVLIRSLAIIKQYYPDVELRLAGVTGRTDFLGDGYLRFLHKEIKSLGLNDNIKWLGAISAENIVSNLQKCSVFVNPSFIESYSMVVAEAMAIGTPCVISYAGAMPELAESNTEALFFTPADHKQLAFCVIKLLSDSDLSRRISIASKKRSDLRSATSDNALEQLKIYQNIISQKYIK